MLDKLHKYRHWKRWLKSEFDSHRGRLRFLITGSARLEIYRKGGDSLQGRYHHWRLHPFSCAEVQGAGARTPQPGEELDIPASSSRETLDSLMEYGGFPEPLLAQSQRTLRRWRKERTDRFFREDVRDLETIRDLSAIETLADLLAERSASPLSINSLREDLEASHRAVSRWIDVLDKLYYVFRVPPFTTKTSRGLRKRPKVYMWDLTSVSGRGERFENLVALHLLKFCHLIEDLEGHRAELFYLRDSLGREADFLVACNRKPWFVVEAKAGDDRIEPALRYFRDRLGIPYAYQVVLDGSRDFQKDGIRCLPAHRFLAALA